MDKHMLELHEAVCRAISEILREYISGLPDHYQVLFAMNIGLFSLKDGDAQQFTFIRDGDCRLNLIQMLDAIREFKSEDDLSNLEITGLGIQEKSDDEPSQTS